MPTIRIDNEVYEWLQKLARPFEDTPNSVLRRVAGLGSKAAKEEEVSELRKVEVAREASEKTPQTAFRKPILRVLAKFGGKGSRMRVLQELEKLMADQLTAYDKSDIASGTIRWQKSAEWEVSVMRDEELLKPVAHAPRGVWALTPEGEAAAREA